MSGQNTTLDYSPGATARPRFVPVEVERAADAALEVLVGEATVRVGPGFDADWRRRFDPPPLSSASFSPLGRIRRQVHGAGRVVARTRKDRRARRARMFGDAAVQVVQSGTDPLPLRLGYKAPVAETPRPWRGSSACARSLAGQDPSPVFGGRVVAVRVGAGRVFVARTVEVVWVPEILALSFRIIRHCPRGVSRAA